jgi:hypothetical protein
LVLAEHEAAHPTRKRILTVHRGDFGILAILVDTAKQIVQNALTPVPARIFWHIHFIGRSVGNPWPSGVVGFKKA